MNPRDWLLASPRSVATFWSRVERREEGECWPWRGSITRHGYGQFAPRKGVNLRAHRVAYELSVGPIPDGLTLDHLCGVKHCVNPAHLEPVTALENVQRYAAARRAATHCRHGHSMADAYTVRTRPGHRRCRTCDLGRKAALRTDAAWRVTTPEQVAEITARLAAGERPAYIARAMGLDPHRVDRVRARQRKADAS